MRLNYKLFLTLLFLLISTPLLAKRNNPEVVLNKISLCAVSSDGMSRLIENIKPDMKEQIMTFARNSYVLTKSTKAFGNKHGLADEEIININKSNSAIFSNEVRNKNTIEEKQQLLTEANNECAKFIKNNTEVKAIYQSISDSIN